MSVLESDKIDGVAVSGEDKVLNLLITDHLDFKDEYKHLLTLQEKNQRVSWFYRGGTVS